MPAEVLADETWAGGCLCGRVRYRCRTKPRNAGYCHCRICQRNAGAPVIACAYVGLEDFAYTAGEPTVYQSTEQGERRFCPTCGTPLEYRERGGDFVSVNVATLDRPEEVKPAFHIWTASRIPWFDTRDDLPRHPGPHPEF